MADALEHGALAAASEMEAATFTIETGFGSRLMTNGFLLNNELTDFSFVPEKNGARVANRVEGGKRPRSSMSPTIVLKDVIGPAFPDVLSRNLPHKTIYL